MVRRAWRFYYFLELQCWICFIFYGTSSQFDFGPLYTLAIAFRSDINFDLYKTYLMLIHLLLSTFLNGAAASVALVKYSVCSFSSLSMSSICLGYFKLEHHTIVKHSELYLLYMESSERARLLRQAFAHEKKYTFLIWFV